MIQSNRKKNARCERVDKRGKALLRHSARPYVYACPIVCGRLPDASYRARGVLHAQASLRRAGFRYTRLLRYAIWRFVI